MKTTLRGFDVNLEQLRVDLKALAEDVGRTDVLVKRASVENTAVDGEDERVTVELSFIPTTESRFSGGYTLPHDK